MPNTNFDYQALYSELFAGLKDTQLEKWLPLLPKQIDDGLCEKRFGDLASWRQVLESLPVVTAKSVDLKDSVTIDGDLDDDTRQNIDTLMRALIPWRKGPFFVHGTHIDTEWRSDWKWDRVLPHLAPLKNRTILDVGCGSGYHCWRMLGEGAERVIGIDPSPRFVVQFYAIKHFIEGGYQSTPKVDVLPVGIEAVPANLQAFDTVFSMGVFYHRSAPMDHLRELKATLRPGGQLVLETLLIEGGLGEVLVPEGRYAMMNNVWFLPSADTILSWLRKCGYKNPRLVDIGTTTFEEQRQTEWMKYHSLKEFLDPNDYNKTAEGHPAPLRGVFIAEV